MRCLGSCGIGRDRGHHAIPWVEDLGIASVTPFGVAARALGVGTEVADASELAVSDSLMANEGYGKSFGTDSMGAEIKAGWVISLAL